MLFSIFLKQLNLDDAHETLRGILGVQKIKAHYEDKLQARSTSVKYLKVFEVPDDPDIDSR